MVGHARGLASSLCRSATSTGDHRHGLGRARSSHSETGIDQSAVGRHPKRLRRPRSARPRNRFGPRRRGCGTCDGPRSHSSDGPQRAQGGAGLPTAGLRVLPAADAATSGLGSWISPAPSPAIGRWRPSPARDHRPVALGLCSLQDQSGRRQARRMNTPAMTAIRLLGWLAVALIGNALLPWVLARGARGAERQDLIDCG